MRIGLAFSFLYAAYGAFVNPVVWIGFIPFWAIELSSPVLTEAQLLTVFSLSEVVLAIWLLSGWKLFTSSLAAVFMLLGLVIFNLGAFDILFRDLSLVAAALALAALSR